MPVCIYALMNRRPRKHMANMSPRPKDLMRRLAKALPQPHKHRPMISHSPSLLRITTWCRTAVGTAPRNLKPISTATMTFNDTVVVISAAQVRGLLLRHATEMCRRRCHPCTQRAPSTSPSLFNTPVRRLFCSPSEIVRVAQPFFRHGVPVIIGQRARARITRRQRQVPTDAHAYADYAPLSTPGHTSHHCAPHNPH
ncbi:hypothetical protein MTO96_046039 [Rhipicephalus appendiculatus]